MITKAELKSACEASLKLIEEAGIYITPKEAKKITAADFGLSKLTQEGIQILTFFDTDRIAGKILVLLPYQTEPEHWHPRVGNDAGKEETVRALWGDLYFYIPGKNNMKHGYIIEDKEECYTMRNEVILNPGDQLTFEPGTKHWFQAGARGAVLYSFSTKVTDNLDQFTDPKIQRETIIID